MSRLLRFVLTVGLLALPAAAPLRGQTVSSLSKKTDPAGTGALMNELRTLFTKWDTNEDRYLDSAELARGFRGADAKPYVPPVRAKKGEAGADKKDAKVPSPPRETINPPDYE